MTREHHARAAKTLLIRLFSVVRALRQKCNVIFRINLEELSLDPAMDAIIHTVHRITWGSGEQSASREKGKETPK